ncbi:hypothetical protein [Brachybacterium sp. UNK5269]|uniref:hypothetical protein n=1 Tax=Brachybacterium sp. UNK5269 TaxID=3408576 RepID=UPI003BAF5990
MPRGYLAGELTGTVLAEAVEVGAATLAIRASQLREGDFGRIRAAGIVPLIWSLRAEEHIRLAVDLGIPWLGADDPARTRRLVEDQLGRAAASRPLTVPAPGAP